jgi:hypothetical protein
LTEQEDALDNVNGENELIIVDDGAASSPSVCIFFLFHSFIPKNPILGVISLRARRD